MGKRDLGEISGACTRASLETVKSHPSHGIRTLYLIYHVVLQDNEYEKLHDWECSRSDLSLACLMMELGELARAPQLKPKSSTFEIHTSNLMVAE